MRLRAILESVKMPRYAVLLVGLALDGVIGFIDYFTGYELAFSLFYVLPLVFVSWFAGRARGVSVSIVSAGLWLTADIAAGNPYSNSLIPVWNTCIRLGFFLIIAFLVAALRKSMQNTEELSRVDSLTGAANARFFYALTDAEMGRLERYGRPLTVAYMDLDNFKTVNDTKGHLAGDAVLRAVVDRARAHLRKTDVVARLGGDEFAFLYPETDEHAAQTVIANLKDRLSEEMRRGDWPVTFSIGVLTCHAVPDSSEDLLRMVDDLMYAAKVGGKNSVNHETFRGHSAEAQDQQSLIDLKTFKGEGLPRP